MIVLTDEFLLTRVVKLTVKTRNILRISSNVMEQIVQ